MVVMRDSKSRVARRGSSTLPSGTVVLVVLLCYSSREENFLILWKQKIQLLVTLAFGKDLPLLS